MQIETNDKRYRIISPERLETGYKIKAFGATWSGSWTVVDKRPNGDYLVEEPEPWKEFFK